MDITENDGLVEVVTNRVGYEKKIKEPIDALVS